MGTGAGGGFLSLPLAFLHEFVHLCDLLEGLIENPTEISQHFSHGKWSGSKSCICSSIADRVGDVVGRVDVADWRLKAAVEGL